MEQGLCEAGYQCRDIGRLNVYTISAAGVFGYFYVLTDWVAEYGIRQAGTLPAVKTLADDSLKIELKVRAGKWATAHHPRFV